MNINIYASFFIAGFRASGSGLNGLNTENLSDTELFQMIEENYIDDLSKIDQRYFFPHPFSDCLTDCLNLKK